MIKNKQIKRAASLALATAVVVSGALTNGAKADAKAKSYNCFLMYANDSFKVTNMKESVANTKVTNKKGSKTYTVTLTKAKAQGKAKASKSNTKYTKVLCVDIKNILKDYSVKKIKISNVVIKCDGKKVSAKFNKMAQGKLEKNQDPNKYRLEIYNEWGEGGTKSHPCVKATSKGATAFSWSKSISVSFKLTLK